MGWIRSDLKHAMNILLAHEFARWLIPAVRELVTSGPK
jgi:hypothetical protein